MKNSLFITILLNVFFMCWLSIGKFAAGDIGMQPILVILTSIVTFLVIILLHKLLNIIGNNLYILHFVIFQFVYFILLVVLNGFYEKSSIIILYIFENNLLGFIARGQSISCILSYIIVFIYDRIK